MRKIVLLLSVLFLSMHMSAREGSVLKVGEQMPAFKLSSQTYGNIASKDLKGKVVLITIFATWCGPCQKELAAFESTLYPKFKDNDRFKLIVVGRGHDEDELKVYNDKKKFTFSLYPDKKEEVTPLFATKFIPRSYLINEDGKVVKETIGFDQDEFDELVNDIAQLLND